MLAARLKLISVGVAAAASGIFAARAQPVDFCRRYAEHAVEDARIAHEHDRCAGIVARYPARFSLDDDIHFNWCMARSGQGTRDENVARQQAIRRCFPGPGW